jgi:hypothetical protein
MACALTQSIAKGCKDAVGGIKAIYVTELANKNTLTSTGGVTTAFTLSTGKRFWQYDLAKETANWKEAIKTANGTTSYEQTVSIKLRKRSAVTSAELHLVAQNYLMIIVQDNNDKYWLVGEANGAELQDSDSDGGTGFSDFNGYTLNFMGKETSPAKEVTSAIMAVLIVAAA